MFRKQIDEGTELMVREPWEAASFFALFDANRERVSLSPTRTCPARSARGRGLAALYLGSDEAA